MPDSAYDQQMAALLARLNNQNLQYGQEEETTRAGYGFDPQYADNPYTKSNLLIRASAGRFNRSTNSFAAQGQLYSGSLSNQRSADEFTSGLERDTAMKDYAAALQGINDKRLAAQTDYQTGSAGAYGDYVGRQVETPAAPVEPAGGAGGGGSSAPSADAVAKAQNILKNPQGKSNAAITWAKSILQK